MLKDRIVQRLQKIADSSTPTKRNTTAKDRFQHFPVSLPPPAPGTAESAAQASERELSDALLKSHLPALVAAFASALSHLEQEVERNDCAPFNPVDVVTHVAPPLCAIAESCFNLRNADAAAGDTAVVLAKLVGLLESTLFFGAESHPSVRRSAARVALLVNAMTAADAFPDAPASVVTSSSSSSSSSSSDSKDEIISIAVSAVDWEALTGDLQQQQQQQSARSTYRDPFGAIPRSTVPHGKAATEAVLALKDVLSPVAVPSSSSSSSSSRLVPYVRAVQCAVFNRHVFPLVYEKSRQLPPAALHSVVVLHFLRPLLVQWSGNDGALLWAESASVARVLCASALVQPSADGARLSTPGTSVAGLRTLCKVPAFAPVVARAILWLVQRLETESPPCRSLAFGLEAELPPHIGPDHALLIRHCQSWGELLLEAAAERLPNLDLDPEDARRIVWVLGFLATNCARISNSAATGSSTVIVNRLAAPCFVGAAEKFWTALFAVSPPHLDSATFTSIAVPIMGEVSHYLCPAGATSNTAIAAAVFPAPTTSAAQTATQTAAGLPCTAFVDMLAAFIVHSATMTYSDPPSSSSSATPSSSPASSAITPGGNKTPSSSPAATNLAAVAAVAAATAAAKRAGGVGGGDQQQQQTPAGFQWPLFPVVGDARIYLGQPTPFVAMLRQPSLTYRALVQWVDDIISRAVSVKDQRSSVVSASADAGDECSPSPTTRATFGSGAAGDMNSAVLLRAVCESCVGVLLGPARRRVNPVSLANITWTCLVRAVSSAYATVAPKLPHLAAEAIASLLNHSTSVYGSCHDPEVANRLVTALINFMDLGNLNTSTNSSNNNGSKSPRAGAAGTSTSSSAIPSRASVMRHLTVLRMLNRLFPSADGFTCIAEQPRTLANLELVCALINAAPAVLRFVVTLSAALNEQAEKEVESASANEDRGGEGGGRGGGGGGGDPHTSAASQTQQLHAVIQGLQQQFPAEFRNVSSAILAAGWQWHFQPSLGMDGSELPLAAIADNMSAVCGQQREQVLLAGTLRSVSDWQHLSSHLATVVLDHAYGVESDDAIRLCGVALGQLCRVLTRSESATLSAHTASALRLVMDGFAAGSAAGRCSPELVQSMMRFVVLAMCAAVVRNLPLYVSSAEAPHRVCSALTALLHAASLRCGGSWGAVASIIEVTRFVRREPVHSFFVGKAVGGVELLVAQEPNFILRVEDILLGPTSPPWHANADDDTDGNGDDGSFDPPAGNSEEFASPTASYNPESSGFAATAADSPTHSVEARFERRVRSFARQLCSLCFSTLAAPNAPPPDGRIEGEGEGDASTIALWDMEAGRTLGCTRPRKGTLRFVAVEDIGAFEWDVAPRQRNTAELKQLRESRRSEGREAAALKVKKAQQTTAATERNDSLAGGSDFVTGGDGGALNITEMFADLEDEMVAVRGDDEDDTTATSLLNSPSMGPAAFALSGTLRGSGVVVAGHEDADTNLVDALNQSTVFNMSMISQPAALQTASQFFAGQQGDESGGGSKTPKNNTGLTSSDDDDDENHHGDGRQDFERLVMAPVDLEPEQRRWPWSVAFLDSIGCVSPTEHPARRILPWHTGTLRVLPAGLKQKDGSFYQRLREIPTHRNRYSINIVVPTAASASSADSGGGSSSEAAVVYAMAAAKLLLRAIVETPHVGGISTEVSADGRHGLRRCANEEFHVHVVAPADSHACFRVRQGNTVDQHDGAPCMVLCPVASHRAMYELAGALDGNRVVIANKKDSSSSSPPASPTSAASSQRGGSSKKVAATANSVPPILFLVPTCRSMHFVAQPDEKSIRSATYVPHVKRASPQAATIFPFCDGAPVRGLYRLAMMARAACLLPATHSSDAYRTRRGHFHLATGMVLQSVPRGERVPPVVAACAQVGLAMMEEEDGDDEGDKEVFPIAAQDLDI